VNGTITEKGECPIARDQKHHIAPDNKGNKMCIWCKQYIKDYDSTIVETKQMNSDGEADSFEIKKIDMRD